MIFNIRNRSLFGAILLVVGMSLNAEGLFSERLIAKEPDRKKVTLGTSMQSFQLTDYRGKEWTEKDFSESKGIVFAFIGTQCPLAKLYTPRLCELQKEFADRSIAFVAVDPNDQDSLEEMGAHARKHAISFPFVKDAGQVVADQFGATRTPEVCVFDETRKLIYRGRIDDQYGIGYIREEPSVQDLRQVIEGLVRGVPSTLEPSPAVGCLIGRRKSSTVSSDVTYCNQVSRILQKNCVSCHRDGEIGPMALDRYEDVASWSEMLLEVIRDQRMPPWHAKEGVGHFANDRRIPNDEIQILEKWVAAGCPEGDRSQLPAPVNHVDGWQLSREPDLVLAMSERPFSVKATGDVRYQYFRVDPKLEEDKWIESAEIVPGNRAVVHHILVFAREKGSQGDLAGHRGFLFGYVPGTRIEPSIPGYAKKLPKNSELIFQVHYTPVGTAQTDLSKIGFLFADSKSITHEIQTTSAVQPRLKIPPGDANYQVDATLPEKLPDCELLSMSPHMHLRGKAFRYTALYPGDKKEVLLDIPKYDFNWQTDYRLAEFKAIPAGTRIHCEATFDNSEKNLNNPDPMKWVAWGDQTYEEMMIGYFHVAVPIDPQTGKAKSVFEEDTDRGLSKRAIFERLDRNNDNQLTADEVPERLKPIIKRMDKNKNGILEASEVD